MLTTDYGFLTHPEYAGETSGILTRGGDDQTPERVKHGFGSSAAGQSVCRLGIRTCSATGSWILAMLTILFAGRRMRQNANYGDATATRSDFQPVGTIKMKNLLFAVFAIATPLLMNFANAGGCAKNSLGQVICAPPGGGAAVNSMGQVVTGRGGCARNNMGQVVCSDSPGGGAAANSMGQVLTGPGECVTNSMGQVWCSSLPLGGAAINAMGQAVCAGECVPGE